MFHIQWFAFKSTHTGFHCRVHILFEYICCHGYDGYVAAASGLSMARMARVASRPFISGI